MVVKRTELKNFRMFLRPTHGLPQMPSLAEYFLKAICTPVMG